MTLKTCVTAYMICIGNHENIITAHAHARRHVFMHTNTAHAFVSLCMPTPHLHEIDRIIYDNFLVCAERSIRERTLLGCLLSLSHTRAN